MISSGVSHTLFFVLLSLLFLVVLIGCRPGKIGTISISRLAFCTALPVVGLTTFFFLGELGNNDKSSTIKIDQFQIPFERLQLKEGRPKSSAVYFVAGEKSENSDLVVRPYADQMRRAELVQDEPRPIFELLLDRGEGDRVDVSLCRINHPASSDLETPGWNVKLTKSGSPLATTKRVRDCSIGLESSGDQIDVALYRIDDIDGEVTENERRSFSVTRKEKAVRIRLHTPINIDVKECKAGRFKLLPGIPLAESIAYVPVHSIRPHQIGAGGINPVLEPRFLGDAMSAESVCASENTTFRWPSFSGENWRISGSIKRNFIPWFMVIFFTANAAILFLLRGAAWRGERTEACVVFILQWLLMIRALIGVAGLYNNPSLSRANILLDAGMSYVCLPVIAVLLMLRPGQSHKNVPIILGVTCLLSFVSLSISLDAGVGHIVPLAYLIITFSIAAWRMLSRTDDSLMRWGALKLSEISSEQALFRFGLFAVLAALLPRALLMVVGWVLKAASSTMPSLTERVGPLPLSVWYQPLLIVGFAALLAATIAHPTKRRAFWVFSLWILSGVVMPALLGDFGIVWIYSWPIGMVISWYAIRELSIRRWLPATLLGATAFAPLGIVALAFLWSSQPVPEPEGEALDQHLRNAVEWNNRDQVRLMRFAAPEKLEQLGNRMSFEMLDQAASLEPLVQHFWGQGYLEPSLIEDPIRKYQFNDNLLPIHIVWPFGRFGLVALLCVVIGSVALLVPRSQGDQTRTLSLLSTMAGMTIAWAAIYMALANLNLAPFTGRNVFLLAVTSGGDAIEGLIMILLLASGFVAQGAVFQANEPVQ